MSLIPRHSLFDIDNVFDRFFAPSVNSDETENALWSPRIDLKETDSSYIVDAELPGVKKEDIHVTLDNGVLSIEAETNKEDKEEKDGKVIRQERRYGKYVRSFSVGNGVSESDIQASFKDGLLKLTVPKLEPESKDKQRIEIS